MAPSADDKKKVGRPADIEEPQRIYMMAGYARYKHLQETDAPKKDVTELVDEHLYSFLAHWGFEDPLRTAPDRRDSLNDDAEEEAAAAAAAAAAKSVAGKAGTAVRQAKQAEKRGQVALPADAEKQAKIDATVTKVRQYIGRLWQSEWRDEKSGANKSSTDMPKLLKALARKPTHKQAYLVWARSHPRPELENEVDRRQAAFAAAGEAVPKRGATWNIVATDMYKNLDGEEKERIRKEVAQAYEDDMEGLAARMAAEAESPEDAVQFMVDIRPFLGDLTQYIANRSSGYAILLLAGPKDTVIMSEGVCDAPDEERVLFSRIAGDEIATVVDRLTLAAGARNAKKWNDTTGNAAPGTQASNDDSAAGQQDATTSSDSPTPRATISTTPVGGCDTTSPASVAVTEDEQDNSMRANAGGLDESADIIQLAAQVQSIHVHEPSTAPSPPASTMSTNPTGDLGERVDGGTTIARSAFAFDVLRDIETEEATKEGYMVAFVAANKAASTKPWFVETFTGNFLKTVPEKLAGKVDVGLACRVALAYLELENSGANEYALTMKNDGAVDNLPLPRYMADLGKRAGGMRWHKRQAEGSARTAAAVDRDVNTTLPRQWALLQPAVRRDEAGRLRIPADNSMSWGSALAPGFNGVRLLIVTLFQWGFNMGDTAERAEWERLAADVARVLEILSEQVKTSAGSLTRPGQGPADSTVATAQTGATSKGTTQHQGSAPSHAVVAGVGTHTTQAGKKAKVVPQRERSTRDRVAPSKLRDAM
ncbi:hypothetical protein PENSPDRAFT_693193 [Peniophora sp. CONT]|nr:hypothetical protein PENSPDRAFT_693193 [Peniophora sp. CONT]